MKRRNKLKKAKNRVKHYSWHFWFLLTLTILAFLLGCATSNENKTPVISGILFGVLVYLSPLFLSVIRNMLPRSLMLKFYKKSL